MQILTLLSGLDIGHEVNDPVSLLIILCFHLKLFIDSWWASNSVCGDTTIPDLT